ncbi:MAG: hypothetical protein ACLP1X_12535 [Polyangiaceae bacterium]|jgi:hypothetical protein
MQARAFWPIASVVGLLVAACGLNETGLGQAPLLGEGGAALIEGGQPNTPAADSAPAPIDGDDAEDMRSGLSDEAGPSSDAFPDASFDAAGEVGGPLDAASCGTGQSPCVVVPAGWTLVAFASTQSSPCPAGFGAQPTDLVEGPTAAAGACSCGACTVTSPPSCDSGMVPVHYDETVSVGAGTCDLVAQPGTGPLMNNPPGSCGTDLYQGSYAGFDISYASPPATGGVCTAPGVASGMGLTYTLQGRSCTAEAQPPSCDGNACTPSIAAPFQACLMTAGSATCPPGNLTARHLVGTAASVTCADCTCSAAATCAGTVTLYTDSTCMTGAYQVPADGSCVPIHKQEASYDSYIYTGGSPESVTCEASGAAEPSVALEGEATICCAP